MTYKQALVLTWTGLGVFVAGYAAATTTGPWSPGIVNGCMIVDATPTYSAGQTVSQTCNTSGQLRVTTIP